jgi:hypothetical protein
VEYELNEIVWAKIMGFPWWPAKITQLPNHHNPLFRVDFFSDNTQYAHPYSAPSSPTANSTNTRPSTRKKICTAPSARGCTKPSQPQRKPSQSLPPPQSPPRPPNCQLKPTLCSKNNYCNHHPASHNYKRINYPQ